MKRTQEEAKRSIIRELKQSYAQTHADYTSFEEFLLFNWKHRIQLSVFDSNPRVFLQALGYTPDTLEFSKLTFLLSDGQAI